MSLSHQEERDAGFAEKELQVQNRQLGSGPGAKGRGRNVELKESKRLLRSSSRIHP